MAMGGTAFSILVNFIQLIGILVPFVGCGILIRKAKSRVSMYLLLANLGCLIINGSYMLLLQTKTYEGAMIALKMEYFGNVVFYLMFGLFLWTYMKLKPYKWAIAFVALWVCVDVMLLSMVWTGDRFHLVFQSLDFEWNENLGLVMIQAKPDFLYKIHCCMICITVLFGVVYTMIRMVHIKMESEKRNLAKLAGAQFVIGISLILMISYYFPFDIAPVCASLSILSIIIGVQSDEFFSIAELGHEWVFEQMEDAFVIVDSMYGYLDSNTYAKKVFQELKFKHKNEQLSGEMVRIFLSGDKIQQIQGKYYNKKVMKIQERGKVSGYSLLLVDVTEQCELMERVKEEKECADAANRAKSAFVSNVSHEIRTPMNAIVGMTQILLRQEMTKQNREYLMNIQNSGNALLAIVNDLLDMSKIESGKMELVEAEYDFMSMLGDLGMIILNRIGNKPVELFFDIDPEIPAKLYGDALRIRQIIINLMNNATKFTEEGYVCLTVKVQGVSEDDMELFISVKDSGQGIREEDIGKLFGAFQQVNQEKNHYKEGTGLGLSISKQLVELMDGSIGVTSEYAKGSEFYFTIHQRIIDSAKAAQLSDDRQKVIIGKMKNPMANILLEKLAIQYGLTYVEDVMCMEKAGKKVFCFTDAYGILDETEKQRLKDLNAVVCGLQNPMAEEDFPKDMFLVNKPLFSYKFCNLLENRQNIEADREPDTVSDKEQEAEESEKELFVPNTCVLVVDDNEINRMVAEEMLKPFGMQVDTASDGSCALEMIQHKKYDLIFMDHLMPVMNGIEAVKALRELDGKYYRNVPVIALTANTSREQQEEYMQAGMNDYLSKPIYIAEIYRIVKKWIPEKMQVSSKNFN